MKLLSKAFVVAVTLALFAPASAAFAGGGGTGADLQVSGSASTGSPTAGTPFSYTFQVKDSGPETAASAVLTDPLPAGFVYGYATVNGFSAPCSAAPDASGTTVVSCALGSIASGAQATVLVNVTAPMTAGTFSNTGTATSSTSDPQPSNNAVTVNVQVKTCTLPAGQTVTTGLVMLKYTDANGMFQDFQLQANGVNYTVVTNFYDGTSPLTTVINLSCKQSPVQFIGVGNFVTVSGTVGSAALFGSTVATPVIYASVVQVQTLKDKA